MKACSLHIPLIGALLAPLLLAAAPAQADTLLIERVEAAREIELPQRGRTMSQVEARFGAPMEKRGPVGGDRPQHPPITRWVYPQFSVYFEHQHVIDAVLNRASELETGPKPVQ